MTIMKENDKFIILNREEVEELVKELERLKQLLSAHKKMRGEKNG
jgi:hypothetical protein